jgi:hypothetical protein
MQDSYKLLLYISSIDGLIEREKSHIDFLIENNYPQQFINNARQMVTDYLTRKYQYKEYYENHTDYYQNLKNIFKEKYESEQ